MINGILSWIISSLFVLSLSYLVLQVIRTGRHDLDFAVWLLVSIFIITSYTLLMGLAGMLAPLPFAVVSLIGLGLMGLLAPTRRGLGGIPGDFRRGVDAFGLWWRALPSWLRWCTALVTVFSAARFSFLVLALPPFVWDSLTYHLTNVAQWVQQGRIGLFETPVTRIYSAANYEVFASWFAVFLHHDVVVEAAGIPAHMLAVQSVYATGRGLGFSREAAWMGALAYGSVPAVLLATTGTKNDPHMAAYYLTAVAILVDFYRKRENTRGRASLGRMAALALAILLAAGTKAYIFHLVPGLIVLGLVGSRGNGGPRLWLDHLRAARQEVRGSGPRLRLALLGLLLLALMVGTYWNIRNWALTGNPFFPYGVSVSGTQVLEAQKSTMPFSLDRMLVNLGRLVEKFGDRKGPITPDLPDTTGWGWVAYGIGIPALLWGLIRRPSLRAPAAGFTTSLLVLYLSSPSSPWNMRYVIWFPALLSLAVSAWIDAIPERMMSERRVAVGIYLVCLTLNLAMTLNYNLVSLDKLQYMLSFPILERQAATLKLNMPGEYENALVTVPKNDTLGYNVGPDGFVYPLYRADFSQPLVYIPIGSAAGCLEIVETMHVKDSRWLFVAPGHTDPQVLDAVERCATHGGGLRKALGGIYEIAPAD